MRTNRLVASLKALGNDTRMRIFTRLMEGTHCNCELADHLDLSLSLVSHHLSVLREADLVVAARDEDDARWVHYSANLATVKDLSDTLSALLNLDSMKERQPRCAEATK